MSDFLLQFRSRRLLCQTLAEFSARQKELIESEADEELADLLRRKDRVLTRLSTESDPQGWKLVRDELDPRTRAECEELLSECEEILAHVQADDMAAAECVVARRDEVKRQLAALSKGRSAAEGYDTVDTRPRMNLVT